MKITRSKLKHLILKEFKINPEYENNFSGFDVDTTFNPEAEEFNQKEVWAVRVIEILFAGATKQTHDTYMIFYSEAQMVKFVNIYMNQPGLTKYLEYLLYKSNITNPLSTFIACQGINDPKIKAELCDEDTDSILIHDHAVSEGLVLTPHHILFYDPDYTHDVTLNCR